MLAPVDAKILPPFLASRRHDHIANPTVVVSQIMIQDHFKSLSPISMMASEGERVSENDKNDVSGRPSVQVDRTSTASTLSMEPEPTKSLQSTTARQVKCVPDVGIKLT